jgi:hypothetical protein
MGKYNSGKFNKNVGKIIEEKNIKNNAITIRLSILVITILLFVYVFNHQQKYNKVDSNLGRRLKNSLYNRYLRVKHSSYNTETLFNPDLPFANTHESEPFEIVECPDLPPIDYPKAYPIMSLLNNWNTDDTKIPSIHYDSICHFNYQNPDELRRANTYRSHEVPFIVYNIPEVDEVVKKWNDLDQLRKILGNNKYRTEISKSNHFMYWHNGKTAGADGVKDKYGKLWTPPTEISEVGFEDWLKVALDGQNKTNAERDHEYFRVSSDLGNNWLFSELPFFQPTPNLMIVEPSQQRGIHCRFGMRNVIAEAHFDGARNSVVELGGLRRWILTHPNQCKNMHMLPKEHPSGRHSEVNWAKPDMDKFPNFEKVTGNEVILQPGDFLYVPTYWIHYIVSLNINVQCNTRSGKTANYFNEINECGF